MRVSVIRRYMVLTGYDTTLSRYITGICQVKVTDFVEKKNTIIDNSGTTHHRNLKLVPKYFLTT